MFVPRLRFLLGVIGAVLILSSCDMKGYSPPLIVSERESIVKKGKVFFITNISESTLHGLQVNINPPHGERQNFLKHTLTPHESFQVGWFELNGWEPPANCTIDIAVTGYLTEMHYHNAMQ